MSRFTYLLVVLALSASAKGAPIMRELAARDADAESSSSNTTLADSLIKHAPMHCDNQQYIACREVAAREYAKCGSDDTACQCKAVEAIHTVCASNCDADPSYKSIADKSESLGEQYKQDCGDPTVVSLAAWKPYRKFWHVDDDEDNECDNRDTDNESGDENSDDDTDCDNGDDNDDGTGWIEKERQWRLERGESVDDLPVLSDVGLGNDADISAASVGEPSPLCNPNVEDCSLPTSAVEKGTNNDSDDDNDSGSDSDSEDEADDNDNDNDITRDTTEVVTKTASLTVTGIPSTITSRAVTFTTVTDQQPPAPSPLKTRQAYQARKSTNTANNKRPVPNTNGYSTDIDSDHDEDHEIMGNRQRDRDSGNRNTNGLEDSDDDDLANVGEPTKRVYSSSVQADSADTKVSAQGLLDWIPFFRNRNKNDDDGDDDTGLPPDLAPKNPVNDQPGDNRDYDELLDSNQDPVDNPSQADDDLPQEEEPSTIPVIETEEEDDPVQSSPADYLQEKENPQRQDTQRYLYSSSSPTDTSMSSTATVLDDDMSATSLPNSAVTEEQEDGSDLDDDNDNNGTSIHNTSSTYQLGRNGANNQKNMVLLAAPSRDNISGTQSEGSMTNYETSNATRAAICCTILSAAIAIVTYYVFM